MRRQSRLLPGPPLKLVMFKMVSSSSKSRVARVTESFFLLSGTRRTKLMSLSVSATNTFCTEVSPKSIRNELLMPIPVLVLRLPKNVWYPKTEIFSVALLSVSSD